MFTWSKVLAVTISFCAVTAAASVAMPSANGNFFGSWWSQGWGGGPGKGHNGGGGGQAQGGNNGGGGGSGGGSAGVPAPIAGAGLPFLLMAGGYVLVRRYRNRKA